MIRLQDGQHIRHGNAIVAAQRCTLGVDVVSIHRQPKTVLLKIMFHTGMFGAYHIHMPLQHHRWFVLVAFGCLLKNHHVVCGILKIAKAVFSGKTRQIVTDGFRVARSRGGSDRSPQNNEIPEVVPILLKRPLSVSSLFLPISFSFCFFHEAIGLHSIIFKPCLSYTCLTLSAALAHVQLASALPARLVSASKLPATTAMAALPPFLSVIFNHDTTIYFFH